MHLQPYRLALRRPWCSARGRLHERCGWLVVARDGHHHGYGDCAPLPEAGTESAPQAQARLHDWCMRARSDDAERLLAALWVEHPSATPAADAAVETALLDCCARRTNQPLRALLQPGAGALDRVAVNAALGPLITCTPEQVQTAAAAGFRVFKLKVGTASVDAELARLHQLLTVLPDQGQVRLDANGAWTLDLASQILTALDSLPCHGGCTRIESLEEPLHQPEDAKLAWLQARTSIPLALDESLPQRPDAQSWPVRRVVLKPGVLGGLRASLALARNAIHAGVEPVVTSLVESAAGLWASAQLAAALRTLTPGTPEICHGLATADWLASDLGPPPPLAHGQLWLSTQPGSGFQPWT